MEGMMSCWLQLRLKVIEKMLLRQTNCVVMQALEILRRNRYGNNHSLFSLSFFRSFSVVLATDYRFATFFQSSTTVTFILSICVHILFANISIARTSIRIHSHEVINFSYYTLLFPF
jgi:hypothetical protein